MKTISVLLVFIACVFTVGSLIEETSACQTALEPQNICLYGNNILDGLGDFDSSRLACKAVNDNPFVYAASAGNSGVTAAQCETYARQDGTACVQFYAKYVCAAYCPLCGFLPCPYFCENYAIICPVANQNHCFQSIACSSGDTAGSTCTEWGIDSAKIPSAGATTKTTTTTTATTKTTKATITTSSHVTTSGTGTHTTTSSDTFTSHASLNEVCHALGIIGLVILFFIF